MNIDRLSLRKLGWNDYFEEQIIQFKGKNLVPCRVVNIQKSKYILYYRDEFIEGKLAGKFRYKAKSKKDFPSVGDWVMAQIIEIDNKALINEVLKRKTSFVRKAPISGGRKIKNGEIVGGTPEEQVIVSNIDTVFIVSGLDDNFNIKRIERYITLVYNSGAQPVIILNKIDLDKDIEKYINPIEDIALGIDIYPISVIENINMDIFEKYLVSGKTITFLGSSGVGKCTIINYIQGENQQRVKSVSVSNGKGRHTTTSTRLLFHDSGCMVIDTPGLRELQLWGDAEALEESFRDIYELTKLCKFKDCHHDTEPECAIKKALEDGKITGDRYESYKIHTNELNKASKLQRKAERHFSRQRKYKTQNYIKN